MFTINNPLNTMSQEKSFVQLHKYLNFKFVKALNSKKTKYFLEEFVDYFISSGNVSFEMIKYENIFSPLHDDFIYDICEDFERMMKDEEKLIPTDVTEIMMEELDNVTWNYPLFKNVSEINFTGGADGTCSFEGTWKIIADDKHNVSLKDFIDGVFRFKKYKHVISSAETFDLDLTSCDNGKISFNIKFR